MSASSEVRIAWPRSAAARADQPADIRLAGTAPPHLGNHGARKDDLDRAAQRLIKNAEQ